MKKLLAVFVCLVVIVFAGVAINNSQSEINKECLRIHIRANSNETEDQDVKLKVRDAVVNYLIPLFENAKDKNDVTEIVRCNSVGIKNVADNILKRNGMTYVSEIKLTRENFPERNYDGVIFESGDYDSVIVNLGSGKGDNWWCVAYPPLCFVPNREGKIIYSSKIAELIKSYKN